MLSDSNAQTLQSVRAVQSDDNNPPAIYREGRRRTRTTILRGGVFFRYLRCAEFSGTSESWSLSSFYSVSTPQIGKSSERLRKLTLSFGKPSYSPLGVENYGTSIHSSFDLSRVGRFVRSVPSVPTTYLCIKSILPSVSHIIERYNETTKSTSTLIWINVIPVVI